MGEGVGGARSQSSTQTGTGNIAVHAQASEGSQVHIHLPEPKPVVVAEAPLAPTRPELTSVEVQLLSVAKEHGGLLPLLRDSRSGRGAYVGPFFNGESLECERELQHLMALGLLVREFSASSTIKFRLTSEGWDRMDIPGSEHQ